MSIKLNGIFTMKRLMSRLRIYPTKQNTIASGVYANYNSSQNPVADLWYGGGASDGTDFRHSISRHLVQFDLEPLRERIADFNINANLNVSYWLRMRNAVPSDKTLDKEQGIRSIQKAIATSYDLIVFPIDKAWDEGRGYDLIQQRSLVNDLEVARLTGYSNWYSATTVSGWTEAGVFADPSASTFYHASQHFAIGDEDLKMDITPIVLSWLSGGTVNNGLGIAFRRDYELMSGNTRYMASFFTNKTNYAFKPYIEAVFDEQQIIDDRMQVTNNRPSRLFLYTFSGNSAANYSSASTVTILDSSNNAVITDLVPVQLEKGVYYVTVFMSGATRGQKYKDVWSGISFNPPYDQQNITQTFSIRDNYYTANLPDLNEYSLDVYGIDNGGTLPSEDVIRVYCDLRVNYSLNAPDKNYNLKYRIVMNNQEDVIPWTNVNQAVINGKKLNYFLLDTSWLLHNQTYTISFKVEELGTSRTLPTQTTFRVLRPFS